MKLTKKQMQAAHIVRTANLDPDPLPVDINPDVQRLGEAMLLVYSLRYTPRFTVLVPAVDDAVGTLRVSAGHVATHPAYRLAVFKKRQ